MIQRRSVLGGQQAAPAFVAAPALMRLPTKRLAPDFYAEWLGRDGEVVHRADWYRRLADGSPVVFRRTPPPHDLFWPDDLARAIRVGALPGSRRVSSFWVKGSFGLERDSVWPAIRDLGCPPITPLRPDAPLGL